LFKRAIGKKQSTNSMRPAIGNFRNTKQVKLDEYVLLHLFCRFCAPRGKLPVLSNPTRQMIVHLCRAISNLIDDRRSASCLLVEAS